MPNRASAEGSGTAAVLPTVNVAKSSPRSGVWEDPSTSPKPAMDVGLVLVYVNAAIGFVAVRVVVPGVQSRHVSG